MPSLIALLVLAASAAFSIRVVVATTRLSTGSAALLGLDVVLVAAVVVAGMLLARARWSRRTAALLLGFQLALLPSLPLDGWNLLILALLVAALVGVAGPWLPGWLRHRPSATGPPGRVVVLLLGLLALPSVAALANPSGAIWGAWLLSGVAVGSAWAFGRAYPAGLWIIRLGLVPVALPAIAQSTAIGGVAVGVGVVALSVLAWQAEAARMVSPLLPQAAETFAIPPEMVPPQVLRDAGYDERGRRLRDT